MQRTLLWSGLALVLSLALLVGAYTRKRLDRPRPLPRFAKVPDFDLVERSGRPFTRQELLGKVWIGDFIFTSCAGVCPEMTGQMKKMHDALQTRADVRCVTFTVDPQNDTVDILRQYAKGFGASEDRWYFVTGEKKALHRLAKDGFKLAVFEDPSADGPFTHSQKFALVDRLGTIRGYYDGTDHKEMRKLKDDVIRLLEE